MYPSVPRMNRRPSPQVGRPSGVYQSTRMHPEPAVAAQRDVAVILESRILVGLAKLPICAATISALVDSVKNRNCSIWCEAMSVRMPPYCSRLI